MLVVLRNLQKLQKVHELGAENPSSIASGEPLRRRVSQKISQRLSSASPSPITTPTRPLSTPEIHTRDLPHELRIKLPKEPASPDIKSPVIVSSLDADLDTILTFKYDPILEKQARTWIEV